MALVPLAAVTDTRPAAARARQRTGAECATPPAELSPLPHRPRRPAGRIGEQPKPFALVALHSITCSHGAVVRRARFQIRIPTSPAASATATRMIAQVFRPTHW